MNKNHDTKNKFLKNIALGSFLLGSFAGIFSQLQAGPLHEAVLSGNMAETHRLLQAGENPNETDSYGYPPLQYAATPEITDLLLNGGADINMPNAWGDTTLRRAVSTHYPNLAHIKQLLQKGAKTDIKDKKGKTSAEAVQEAIEWGVVRNGHFIISTELCDDARLAYAEALKLFFLPQHLWPKRSFFRKILDLF